MKSRALIAAALAAASCSITHELRTVTATDISRVCIRKNPAVLMSGFVTELRTQLEAKGMRVEIHDDPLPLDCRHWLEYSANWRWDWTMYPVFIDLRMHDGNTVIGQATYDARDGGARPDKWIRTTGKLKGLVDGLFPR
jgi:hypothetical protein